MHTGGSPILVHTSSADIPLPPVTSHTCTCIETEGPNPAPYQPLIGLVDCSAVPSGAKRPHKENITAQARLVSGRSACTQRVLKGSMALLIRLPSAAPQRTLSVDNGFRIFLAAKGWSHQTPAIKHQREGVSHALSGLSL